MSRPPQYPEFIEPGAPRWRRWWLGLGLLYGVQCALLLMLWPEAQPRLQLWLWSALLPLCWALVLAVRVLAWQIALFNRKVYLRRLPRNAGGSSGAWACRCRTCCCWARRGMHRNTTWT